MTSQDVVDFVSQRMSHGVEKLSTICEEVYINNCSLTFRILVFSMSGQLYQIEKMRTNLRLTS